MGRYVSQEWHGNPQALRARDRRTGRFNAYIPHMLEGWQPTLTADVVAFLGETERVLVDTASRLKPHAGGDICSWAESLGSSHIEGVAPNPKRVVQALAKRQHTGKDATHGAVAAVIGNIDATAQAQEMLAQRQDLRLETLLDAHRTLMAASPTPHFGGVVRSDQNWVGGNDWHPLDSEFVPPPARMCLPLLEDLIVYLRGDGHPPLLQAAVAHAQFETIHPFGDGNGRAGRAVLYGVLKDRCVPTGMMPPVSLALSRNRDAYLQALAEFQTYIGDADHAGRSEALVRWLEVLADAVQKSSAAVVRYQRAVGHLQNHWRSAVGGRTRRSVAAAVLDYLPANPSVTHKTLAEATGFSQQRCGDALRRLEAAGVVKGRSGGPSLRVYDADKVFEAFKVMSSTVCDPRASDNDYALLLADPLLATGRDAATTRSSKGLCPRNVKSSGMPCGLIRGHKGHCRHLPYRKG